MVIGILLTLFIGFLWSLVGVVFKFIAKENLKIFDISLVSSAVSFFVVLGVLHWNLRTMDAAVPDATYWTVLIVGSCINAAGSYVLQWSMKYCRSSVAWAIGQSALIIPFLSITLIFHEPWLVFKILGTLVIVLGMIVLSCSPAKKTQEMPRPMFGVMLALVAFLVLGVGQSLLSSSSYLPYVDDAGYRPVLGSIGGFIAIIGGKLAMRDYGFSLNKKAWYVIIYNVISGVIVALVQYRAMDYLKDVGMNACFFPIAVGTCIALYSVWSVVVFKESTNRFVIGGTAAIVCGIVAYCFC